jgi:hypothetical protein
MVQIPLDQPPRRRRVGPFWIEEGIGPLLFGLGAIALVVALYVFAALTNHP